MSSEMAEKSDVENALSELERLSDNQCKSAAKTKELVKLIESHLCSECRKSQNHFWSFGIWGSKPKDTKDKHYYCKQENEKLSQSLKTMNQQKQILEEKFSEKERVANQEKKHFEDIFDEQSNLIKRFEQNKIELKKKIEELEQKTEIAKTEEEKKQIQINELKTSNENKEKELNDYKQQYDMIQKQVKKDFEKKLNDEKLCTKRLQRQNELLTAEKDKQFLLIKDLEEKNRQIGNKESKALEEQKVLNEKIIELKDQINKQKKDIESLSHEKQKFEKVSFVYKEKVTTLQSDLKTEREEAENKKHTVNMQQKQLEEKIELAKQENGDLEASIKNMITEKEQLLQTQRSELDKSSQLKEKIKTLQNQVDTQRSEFDKIRKQLENEKTTLQNEAEVQKCNWNTKLKMVESKRKLNIMDLAVIRQKLFEHSDKCFTQDQTLQEINRIKKRSKDLSVIRQELFEHSDECFTQDQTLQEINHIKMRSKELTVIRQELFENSDECFTQDQILQEINRIKMKSTCLDTECLQLKEDLRKLREKPRKCIDIDVYNTIKQDLSYQALNAISSLIENHFKEKDTDIKFRHPSNPSDIKEPCIVFCLSMSRIGSDVSASLKGLKVTAGAAVIIFHHKEEHNLPAQSSEKKLPEYKQLGAIIDMAIYSDKGLYTCDMNRLAIEKLEAFLKRFVYTKRL